MTALRRAGFAERAELAYALLLNNAILTVSIGDDRRQHENDGPRDHAAMMAEFQHMPTASDELGGMADQLVRPFVEGGETAARVRDTYYRFAVGTTIAGLAVSLQTKWSSPGRGDRRMGVIGRRHRGRVKDAPKRGRTPSEPTPLTTFGTAGREPTAKASCVALKRS